MPKKIIINLSNKALYSLIALFVIIAAGFIVYAQYSQIPDPGHGGDSVVIDINGQEKTLQQAIYDGDLESYGSLAISHAVLLKVDTNTIRITFPKLIGWNHIEKDISPIAANTLYLIGIKKVLTNKPTANDVLIVQGSAGLDTNYAFIGSVRTDSSSSILNFVMPSPGKFYYSDEIILQTCTSFSSPFCPLAYQIPYSNFVPTAYTKDLIISTSIFTDNFGGTSDENRYVKVDIENYNDILLTSPSSKRAQTVLSIPSIDLNIDILASKSSSCGGSECVIKSMQISLLGWESSP